MGLASRKLLLDLFFLAIFTVQEFFSNTWPPPLKQIMDIPLLLVVEKINTNNIHSMHIAG